MSTRTAASLSSRRRMRTADRWMLVSVAATAALAFVPAADPILYPLRLFVTILHEGAHALAAIATGGHVVSIALHPSGSGLTHAAPGLLGLYYSAGYVGTVAAGAAGLLLCRRERSGRIVLIGLGLLIAALTALWMRNLFGLGAGAGIAAVLLLAGWKLPRSGADLMAAFLSVQLLLHAILDIRTLWFLTTSTSLENDAVLMARAFGGPAWLWAGTWAVASAGILLATLRAYLARR
ncbi:MAG TPA: M50 family metallopeptidase [Chthonomonadales bacterium]|nr:M50 family metallopeptidase [Chthonomonadales bacterium]